MEQGRGKLGTIVMSLAAARGYSLPERGRTGPLPEPTGLVRPEHFRRIKKIAPPQVSALSRDSLIINPATTGSLENGRAPLSSKCTLADMTISPPPAVEQQATVGQQAGWWGSTHANP